MNWRRIAAGQQTLRAFRVADGKLIGTFRPHARITTWASDASGQKIVIGGQDGSLLTAFLYDETTHPDAQQALAVLPSRRFLAEHLGIAKPEANVDVRNLTIVSKAVQKFKGLTVAKQQNSAVCSIQ
ncbi:Leucine-rich repeat and WD repeat-containing protein [Aphelenchoides fujianensis]|nr:Leucine-rich repeat and WD repeat-containing protein [Aphelenchoides fujianensis]